VGEGAPRDGAQAEEKESSGEWRAPTEEEMRRRGTAWSSYGARGEEGSEWDGEEWHVLEATFPAFHGPSRDHWADYSEQGFHRIFSLYETPKLCSVAFHFFHMLTRIFLFS
jgi:hypothetical protein